MKRIFLPTVVYVESWINIRLFVTFKMRNYFRMDKWRTWINYILIQWQKAIKYIEHEGNKATKKVSQEKRLLSLGLDHLPPCFF